jgi:hypothetical protein
MRQKTLIDTILRAATVDLFHSCSVAIAPVPEATQPLSTTLPEVAAFIDFSAPGFSGTLYLCCPAELVPREDAKRKVSAEDWVRELVNQLLGRIKKRLAQSRVDLHAGLPKTGNAELIQRHFARVKHARCYEFRTLRGSIMILIDGVVRDSIVDYSGEAAVAREGDIILFEPEVKGG